MVEVEEGQDYLSPSGLRFRVLHKAYHGQDCTHFMIVYTNLEPTNDKEAGKIWVMSESLFLKLFREHNEDNHQQKRQSTR